MVSGQFSEDGLSVNSFAGVIHPPFSTACEPVPGVGPVTWCYDSFFRVVGPRDTSLLLDLECISWVWDLKGFYTTN